MLITILVFDRIFWCCCSPYRLLSGSCWSCSQGTYFLPSYDFLTMRKYLLCTFTFILFVY